MDLPPATSLRLQHSGISSPHIGSYFTLTGITTQNESLSGLLGTTPLFQGTIYSRHIPIK